VLDVYRKLYFEGGTSSAYYFETSEEEDSKDFGACFLIHKDTEESKALKQGWWNSVHVFDVKHNGNGVYEYNLTTSIMISMKLADGSIGNVDLSGTMQKSATKTQTLSVENPHIATMGTLMENLETRLRNELEGTYIQKTRQVVNGMRNPDSAKMDAWKDIAGSLKAREN
jgi:capping protein beta